jgi:hypothetical protein
LIVPVFAAFLVLVDTIRVRKEEAGLEAQLQKRFRQREVKAIKLNSLVDALGRYGEVRTIRTHLEVPPTIAFAGAVASALRSDNEELLAVGFLVYAAFLVVSRRVELNLWTIRDPAWGLTPRLWSAVFRLATIAVFGVLSVLA